MIPLYDDQSKLVDETRQAMRRSKSVLVQAATGFGKTRLAAHMCAAAAAKGHKAMMVVPRRELLKQTAESFTDLEIPFGYVAAGRESNPFAKVTLATSGTLVRRLDTTPEQGVVFIDETHYGASQLDKIINHYKDKGSWVIGLSATPERLDGRGLGCWYGGMVQGPPVADLIADGRLSGYRMFAPDTPDMTDIRKTAGDYAKGQLAEKMESDRVLVGNSVRHYRQHAMGMLDVVFCASIKHAEIVAEAFNLDGIPAAVIHGGMSDADRLSVVRAFARRELLALCSVDLLTFGFDLSSAAQMDVTVEAITDLAPTQSLAKQMQKYGRALRAKPFPAILLDHAGNSARHGLPDDPREWTLADKDRNGGGGGDRADPVRQCETCFFVHPPAPTCPECGFVYPIKSRMIEEVDGDLSEVTAGARKLTPKQEQGQADSLDDLIRLGKLRGYKRPDLWAAKIMTGRMAKSR